MQKYDVIIIGSGLGGLECGYILSKEGYKVCILEKNKQIGGNLQTFVRDKCIFDTGVHYIGGLDEGQNLNRFLKYFGIMDDLRLRKMDVEGFDLITFDGDHMKYPHAMGYDRFIDNLSAWFPKERRNLERYCEKIQDLCQQFPLYNIREGDSYVLNTDMLEINAMDYINSVISDPKLRNVVAGSNPLYAGVSDKTPLYVHALVSNTYIESAWRCVDGGSQIAKYLVRRIRENGGALFKHKEVVKFGFKGGDLKNVLLANGEVMEAKYFISNIHPAATLDMVEEGRIRKVYRNRIKGLENTISVFSVHITLKEKKFPYLNHNYYHYCADNVWDSWALSKTNWPGGYMLSTPASSKSEEWADCITLMVYMDYGEVKQWENTFNTVSNGNDRNEDYQRFKTEKAEIVIDLVAERWPEIRSAIKNVYTSTPLSYRDYIGTSDGSLYGVMKDHKNPMKSFISPRTKIPNLLLTGQNLNLHGILGVTVGSIVTCSELLGAKYLVDKVKAA